MFSPPAKPKENGNKTLICCSSPLGEKWTLAKQILPTEIIERLQGEVSDNRKKVQSLLNSGADIQSDEISHIQERISESLRLIDELGGDINSLVKEIYSEFDYESYWFRDGFGKHDEAVISHEMKDLAGEKNVPMSELKLIALGTGNGRDLDIPLDILRKEMEGGRISAQDYEAGKRNIFGLDNVPEVITTTKERMADHGIPKENIFLADFLETIPKEHEGRYDLVEVMMHTLWHCKTEQDWKMALENISKLLKPGGRVVFDTVDVITPGMLPQNQGWYLRGFGDLTSLYSILHIKYCQEKQPLIDSLFENSLEEGQEVPQLREIPRHLVEDSTAGVKGKRFVREIPTEDFIKGLCEKHGIDLFKIRVAYADIGIIKISLKELGESWIKQNNLSVWLNKEIINRLEQTSDPETLKAIEETGLQELAQSIYEDIVLDIARYYSNTYSVMKKGTKSL